MNRETLEQYGWLIVSVIIVVCILAAASPLGKYIFNAINATTNTFNDVADTADYDAAQQEAEQIFGDNELTPNEIYG